MIVVKIILGILELIVLGLMIWHGFTFKIGSIFSFQVYSLRRFFIKKE